MLQLTFDPLNKDDEAESFYLHHHSPMTTSSSSSSSTHNNNTSKDTTMTWPSGLLDCFTSRSYTLIIMGEWRMVHFTPVAAIH